MTAESELENSKLLLEMLKHSPKRSEFRRYFSIFDGTHMLLDYAEKYKLGISILDKIYAKDFEERARSLKIKKLFEFIEQHKNEGARSSRDNVVKVLIPCRDMEDHRATVPFQSSHDPDVSIGSPSYAYELRRRMGYIQRGFNKSPKDIASMTRKSWQFDS